MFYFSIAFTNSKLGMNWNILSHTKGFYLHKIIIIIINCTLLCDFGAGVV